MATNRFLIDRRLVLKGGAAAAAGFGMAPMAQAQNDADALLFTISDLHAPYARLPALLETIRTKKAEANAPAALLVNGDIFERGNVVCLRSGGVADWAFLSAVAAEMPVVVNLGNHETALLDDISYFVASADQAGLRVISNLVDRRTGRFFAPVADRLDLGGINISLLGLAATDQFVYREPVRETLTFLDTAQFVADAFQDIAADAQLNLVMSHAGVSPDKSFIDTLPPGTVVQGAHDHITLNVDRKGVRYFHGGSWGSQLGMLSLKRIGDAVQSTYQTIDIAPQGGDSDLLGLVDSQKAEHLTDADRTVIAHIPKTLDMHRSILVATQAMQLATEADVALIGHTTFGAPLTAGELTNYDFDSYVRFGGAVKAADVPGDVLMQVLGRANQFKAATLDGRSGDYVHVAEVDLDTSRTYRLVVNGWTALNQAFYLGTKDIEFEDVEGLELKALIAEYVSTTYN